MEGAGLDPPRPGVHRVGTLELPVDACRQPPSRQTGPSGSGTGHFGCSGGSDVPCDARASPSDPNLGPEAPGQQGGFRLLTAERGPTERPSPYLTSLSGVQLPGGRQRRSWGTRCMHICASRPGSMGAPCPTQGPGLGPHQLSAPGAGCAGGSGQLCVAREPAWLGASSCWTGVRTKPL